MIEQVKLPIQVIIILQCLILIKMFSTSPGTVSGNGNPALLFILPLIFILGRFGFAWLKWLRGLRLSTSIRVLILLISIVVIVLTIIYSIQAFAQFEVDFKVNYEKKYHRSLEPGLFELMTRGVNIHTNYLYFNNLTLLALVSFLNLVGVTYSFIKPQVQEVNKSEEPMEKEAKTPLALVTVIIVFLMFNLYYSYEMAIIGHRTGKFTPFTPTLIPVLLLSLVFIVMVVYYKIKEKGN